MIHTTDTVDAGSTTYAVNTGLTIDTVDTVA